MIELHPEIIEKDGKKEFVILTHEESLAIEEALADVEDLTELRVAKKEDHDAPYSSGPRSLRRWGYEHEATVRRSTA